ncbi:hypothetical protein [Desulfuribacillus alkaliarsenatis]|uniref:Uncharacterized protein n=1 Tax=Desulfuribacillus alkaliarsenatis TaxID=766136 RepID=A0A1E5FYK1_9FIRM|nr:hypothetical protein [Desulfuribacillus alkaliarsenatis]OEF95649.1 hypothetical protein BHF68_12455 [Desulfuribacillus alkaliarsenatis]
MITKREYAAAQEGHFTISLDANINNDTESGELGEIIADESVNVEAVAYDKTLVVFYDSPKDAGFLPRIRNS